MSERFDWPVLMQAGMRGLGLRPADFWALTPAELAFLLGQGSGRMPMDRTGLEELAARFPDRMEDDDGS
ncbi:rcc01693 family protein [Jannaschia ovalis]|uniref:Phage tail assembly chaperone n=1 Tax=Jannaschia ovalis TaxID=3038773 RepID=A0ABY8LB65_9RHOB|nr:rcc01693 family protein [Jannaschia sp. GRR-S6-38]WGH78361.1 phage tail assembly chaperone [Jannaschia sp. GRR-S6-38]